jgi:hypothetical protein
MSEENSENSQEKKEKEKHAAEVREEGITNLKKSDEELTG